MSTRFAGLSMVTVSLACALAFVIGCGNGGGSSGTAGTGGSGGGSSGGSGGSGGSSTGGTGTGGSMALSCEAYCNTIQANCTADNQQFTTNDNCMNSCKAMPVGTAADMMGNTLGCRTYHAGAAKMDPATHCAHAGPGGAGVCGADCDGFCQIAMMYCTDANKAKVYDTLDACQTDCKAHKTDVKYSTKVDSGNEVACLLYHVQEGSSAPADHCLGDLAAGSMTCK